MILVLFGILLLAFSWVLALPIFFPFLGETRWVIFGVALIVVGLRNNAFWQAVMQRGTAAAVLVAAMVGIILFSGPFQTGLLILLAASLLVLLPLPSVIARWALPGLWVSGAILVVQSVCMPLLYVFTARYHRTSELPILHDVIPGYPAFPWLATLLYGPLKLLSPGTALDGSTLYLPTTLDTLGLTPTWEKLGLIPIALFTVGMVLVMLLRRDWRRRLPGLILLVMGFAYVRLLFLFLLVNHVRKAEVFWRFDYQLYSFLPLPLLLGAWWALTSRGEETLQQETPKDRSLVRRALAWLNGHRNDAAESAFAAPHRPGRIVLATIVLVGGLTALLGFHDPGTPKAGRILIDEGHSDWEWTTQPFDTVWYGAKSGYNYYCLADYWDRHYAVETRTDSLTGRLLAGYDVVVIKTPTSPFSPAEVEAIVDFVRDGGGLFLIGDHTNVFGTSTYMNPIAERFGLYFRYDATYNLHNLGLSFFSPPERFPHPVVRFMPDFLFATSCTMYSPLLSENVILGYGLRAMYLDYSETSYFPTKEGKVDYNFGLFVQAGGVKYGKGRVLGYTDSTCFSNFFMFMPGKPELALASIEWLNRKNRWAWLERIFLLASIVGLILIVREFRRHSGVSTWNVVIPLGVLVIIIVGWLTERSVTRSYPLPRPNSPPLQVAFDQGHGNYVMPTERLAINNWQNFQTFYVWTQRLGLIPRNDASIAAAVQESEVLVEIQPFRPFTIADIDRVVDYVRRGGTLVVLDSPENEGSTANSLLGPFRMAFDGRPADSLTVINADGDTLGIARQAYGVRGGKPLLKLTDNRVAMAHTPFGEGHVVACGAAYIFCAESTGTTAVFPDARQRRLFQAEYDIFLKVAGLRVPPRYQEKDTPHSAGAPRDRTPVDGN